MNKKWSRKTEEEHFSCKKIEGNGKRENRKKKKKKSLSYKAKIN